MQNFPQVSPNKVVLMRADTFTGHVLDELFYVANSKVQSIYTVVNSFDEALTMAKEIINLKDNVECVIYDYNQKVLSFLRP